MVHPIQYVTTALLLALSPTAPKAAEPDEREVEAAFQAVQAAVERRDAADLQRRVHPRFEMLHGLGQLEGRDGWLRLVEGGRLPRQTTERSESEVAIHVVGDTAMRGSILRMRDRARGRDMWLRGTATFVKRDGRWVQLRQQSTLLHDGPLADATQLQDFAGSYHVPGREGFAVEIAGNYLRARWTTGATLPLVPRGGDAFGAGPTSTLVFLRNEANRVTGARREGPEGTWWSAVRTPAETSPVPP